MPESLNLYIGNEAFHFEPNYTESLKNNIGKPTLQITRPKGIIKVNEAVTMSLSSKATMVVFGIMGMIQLLSGPYLIVITERKLACRLLGHNIWRITGSQILPCDPNNMRALTPQQQADEKQYISLLKSFLASDYLFYSQTYDLTRSIQDQTLPKQAQFPFADLNFTVNRAIVKPFTDILTALKDTKLEDFLIFAIEGFAEFKTMNIHHKKISFGIISRRATGRVGTRYHSRGIDDLGHVSNCVETEQILILDENEVTSFVQVRGSIPLFWRQNININYKPPFEFYNQSNMGKVFDQHFKSLSCSYGKVSALNLVNHRGWEGELAKAFAKFSRESSVKEMRYIAFDFNKECPMMQWQNVALLMDMIEGDLLEHGYFAGKIDPTNKNTLRFSQVTDKQGGVVRTNCIDCLDRTNLVQGFIGKKVLLDILHERKVISSKDDSLAELEMAVKHIWADNGDAISKQYSGTGALKADFTRTGKRTRMGLLNDGLNSMMRYFLNNFTDGARQDAMDLFYGHYTVRLDNSYSPFIFHLDKKLIFAPLFVALSFVLMVYLVMKGRFMYGVIFAALCAFTVSVVLRDGIKYVQYPKLRPPPVAIQARSLHSTIKRMTRGKPTRKVHII